MNKLLLLGEIMTTITTFPVGQQHSYSFLQPLSEANFSRLAVGFLFDLEIFLKILKKISPNFFNFPK